LQFKGKSASRLNRSLEASDHELEVMKDTILISIVVPMFNEEGNVATLTSRFEQIKESNPGFSFELIVVDDGSTDGTLPLLLSAARATEGVSVVSLARNFGSHHAISAGLSYADGDASIVLSGDHQEPVAIVGDFISRWKDGNEVVWGVRKSRDSEPRVSRWASAFFSRLLTRFSDVQNYPVKGPAVFLCSRRVTDELGRLKENHRNLVGLISWLGFSQDTIEFEVEPRRHGHSKWRPARKVKMAIDSFVQFSHAPIRLMTYVGGSFAVLGFVYASFLVIRRLGWDDPVLGWTSVTVLILIIGGLQLIMLGILGEYLWRSADEARQRPIFVIKLLEGPAAHRVSPELPKQFDSAATGQSSVLEE